jgi:hypothetical protein
MNLRRLGNLHGTVEAIWTLYRGRFLVLLAMGAALGSVATNHYYIVTALLLILGFWGAILSYRQGQ